MMAEAHQWLKQTGGTITKTALALFSLTMVGSGWVPAHADTPPPVTSRASGDTAKPIPGVVQPYCGNVAQQPLNRCIGRWLQVTEQLHKLVYEEVVGALAVDDAQQLDRIHQQWTQFRDEHCDLVAMQVLGGSAYPMLWGGCRASLTNERIAALQFWGQVTMEPEQAFQRLQELDAELQPDPDTDWSEVDAFWREFSGREHRDHAPRYDVAQSLWIDYRDTHCDVEVMQLTADAYFPNVEGLDDWIATHPHLELDDAVRLRCHTRLTVERLAQLEDLAGMGW